jgi:acetyl-CoA acetyltransferase
MFAPLLKDLAESTKLDPKLVEDVVVGNVLQPGAGML